MMDLWMVMLGESSLRPLNDNQLHFLHMLQHFLDYHVMLLEQRAKDLDDTHD